MVRFKSGFLGKNTLLTLLVAMVVFGAYLFANNLYKDRVTPRRAQAYDGSGFVIDHTSVDLFNQIPDEYIEAAANIRMFYMDRSVGGNINDGLTCLGYSSVNVAPHHCKSPNIEVSGYTPDSKYDRSNWVFQYWPAGSASEWEGSLQSFLNTANPILNEFDVLSFQFSYLGVADNSTIADPLRGFFVSSAGVKDVYDYQDFENAHSDKDVIYWTSSLARGIGNSVSTDFNDQMRQFAIANGKVLFDVADIESHDPSGNPCYDNRDGIPFTSGNRSENYPNDGHNYPAICPDYTSEVDGGHLGNMSTGKIRIAKAFWVLMARLAGWEPDGAGGTPRLIITPTPGTTLTPVPVPTTTPPVATQTPRPQQTSAPTPAASGSVHVADLDVFTSTAFFGWRANSFVVVHDENHNPVGGATVTFTYTGEGVNFTKSCVTRSGGGNCTVSGNVLSGSVTSVNVSVSDIQKEDKIYFPSDSHDVDGETDGTYSVATH